LLAVLTFMVGLAAKPASANHVGAWRTFASDYPNECGIIGSYLYTDTNPDKHEVNASNACITDQDVKVALWHYDSAGRIEDSCSSGYATNYAQCGVQASTLAGDYWKWIAYITSAPSYTVTCSNQFASYVTCYETTD
jgi:hypothetical protein